MFFGEGVVGAFTVRVYRREVVTGEHEVVVGKRDVGVGDPKGGTETPSS